MKYDGNYFNYFANKVNSSTRKAQKKKSSKPKAGKITVKMKLQGTVATGRFVPCFTFHSLTRLSERIQAKRYKEVRIWTRDMKACVIGPLLAGWIDPNLIRSCLHDIDAHMIARSYYSKTEDRLLVRGSIAWYALGRDGNIITLFTTPEKGYLKYYSYELASKQFVTTFFCIKVVVEKNQLFVKK